ncbi:sensor histidine kinase [Vulcaniibacterium gelatinicum]|uniref:sensor histidine kinase n=1 Tax=Vulcaniibacterium gelatinicum TaxID=2598725 RepID=UPI0015F2AE16|nr:ATP-binding protein [Vulcaniibacterium gelatinicum]
MDVTRPLSGVSHFVIGGWPTYAGLAGLLLLSVSALAFVGWFAAVPALTASGSGFYLMRPATALGVAVLGTSLLCAGSGRLRVLATPAASLLVAVAALDFAQTLGLVPGRLDAWLVSLVSWPGRSPQDGSPLLSGAMLLALGLALWLLPARRRWRRRIGNLLATGVFGLGLLSSLGYGYGYTYTQGFRTVATAYPVVPLPFAFAAMAAALVLLGASRDGACVRLLTARGEGGRLARRLLPVSLLVPILIGWLQQLGEWMGYYDRGFGDAMAVVASIGVFTFVLYRYSRALEYADIQRRRAARRLNALNAALEARVHERTAQLEAAVQNLESFSYSVSHDLRAPLRSIDNFSQFLVEDYADRLDAEGQRLVGVIRRNAQRMGQLIDDMLAFSRAGTCEMVHAPFDPAPLVETVLEDLAVDRERCEIVVGPLPRLHGDKAMIRQVLFNLLSNAVKFSASRERPRIEVAGTVADGEARITVTDNGVGFDPAFAHKLFRMFERLHPDAEFEGTGVGLAIVRRIVERHGGRVWAEGNVGAGASFGFSLPLGGGTQ